MITVNQALDINRVEEPIARAFKDHIGGHILPYVDVSLMDVRGYDDEVVRRIPEGHGEFREEITPIYNGTQKASGKYYYIDPFGYHYILTYDRSLEKWVAELVYEEGEDE